MSGAGFAALLRFELLPAAFPNREFRDAVGPACVGCRSTATKCYDVSMQKAARKVLELNLFENGVDFIRSAIEDYFLNDTAKPAAFKYAVLHMYAGVLLLLKERIRREAPLFVFKKNKKTLNFSEIQSVLPSAGVTLQATDLKMLKKFQERRNVLEHYECHLDLEMTKALLGQLAAFTYFFLRDQLSEDLEDHLEASTALRLRELKGIYERRTSENRRAWRQRATRYFGLTNEEVETIRHGAETFDPRDEPYPHEFIECPECTNDSVVMLESDVGLCTNVECKMVFSAEECLRCDSPVFYGSVFCDACQAYIDDQ